MKKVILFFFSFLVVATAGFAENLTLDNQTPYPNKSQNTKMAVQWAATAADMDDANYTSMYGTSLKPDSLQVINDTGRVKLTIPKKSTYFRIVVWSKPGDNPDLVTNWVDIIPNKTYTLKTDRLMPAVLMLGFGC